MKQINLHPCDSGDLPAKVLYRCFTEILPIKAQTARKHWKERYPFFVRNKEGLYIDVKAADLWLDQRGEKLFSESLLEKKREKNPDWRPVDVNRVATYTLTADDANKADFNLAQVVVKTEGVA